MIINSAVFTVSNSNIAACPQHKLPEYAFIGRSNVGKSSLINMLTKSKKLAKTSQTPGKTQLINHFLINNSWYLVDLPGIGFAKSSKHERVKWENFIADYFKNRTQLTNAFVLIDSRLEPQQIDVEFMEWLGSNGVPFSIVFTKTDKLSKNNLQKNIDFYCKTMAETWEEMPPYFISSAETNFGREELLAYINEINLSLKS